MDVLLLDPAYRALKGVAIDYSYNMALTSLAAFLREGAIDTGILSGDLVAAKSGLSSISPFNVQQYAAGQGSYESLIDDDHHPFWQSLVDEVLQHQPRAVALSCLTPAIASLEKTVRLLKRAAPSLPIIVGGHHATFLPTAVMSNPDIDYVIGGEGEIPLLALARELRRERPRLEAVPGLYYRGGASGVLHNPAPAAIRDLDALPFPARDLLLNSDYQRHRTHAIASARGCPYTCTFCADKTLWGRKVRRRSVDSVIAEMKHIKATYPVQLLDFLDGTFTYNAKYLRQFCQRLIDEDVGLPWRCTARYDNITPQLLQLMRRAGCRGLYFGLESGSERVLQRMDKRITVDTIVTASAMIRDSGIPSIAAILVGLPDEDENDLRSTLDLMRRIHADLFDINSYVPLPGTPLFDAMTPAQQGRIDWKRTAYKSLDNHFSNRVPKARFRELVAEAYHIADQARERFETRMAAMMTASQRGSTAPAT